MTRTSALPSIFRTTVAPRRLRTLPGSSITGPALHAAARLRTREWNRAADDPELPQRRALAWLLEQTARTALGRAHGLRRVGSYEAFRAAVPVREYTDFLPWLERMRAGERDVLWPGLVPYFALSGGTTRGPGGLKYLPVSRDQLRCQHRMAFDGVARYVTVSGTRALTGGYALALVPPAVVRREGPVGVSSNPGLLHHQAPRASRLFSLPRAPVSQVEDFEARFTQLAEAYLDHDVRLLAGTPCWFSVLFEKLLAAARARGRRVSTVREIWPNLRGVISGGSNPGPYRALFAQALGPDLTLIDHYNSTEAGLIACADRSDADDLLMVPDRGVFYEFIARSEYGKAGARRVPLWQVEAGVDYAVVLSTPSGLLGYSLGDVVRFTTCFPHRLRVIGRVHGGLSPAHEVTSEGMVEAAVAFACAQTGATLTEFTAAADGPLATGKTRYRFYLELQRAPASREAFRAALDEELQRQNLLYAMYRKGDVAMLMPELELLPSGTTARFMRALGPRSVQQKFPHTVDGARRDLLERVRRED
ncbi:MAG: GH3 auxin-responsive promoter family protein [Archangiaceae bacterium]|nr:GH3 auxin-responsive promoter family protein [Archangiaceae bacterium]